MEMETLKIKGKNKAVPKLRFREFEEDWQLRKFGDITIKVGSGSTPRGGSEVYQDNGIPFIRSQNVTQNQLILDNTFISEEINEQMKGSIVHPNDILLNITGASIGRSCLVPKDFKIGNVNQHVCIIRMNSKYDPKFVQVFLFSAKGQRLVDQGQTGSGREGLNFQSIRLFKSRFPTLQEQQKIASFLSAVDKKIQQLDRKKELLETYKKGVMQQLFSQEIRFKDEDGRDFLEWEEKKLGDIATFSKGKGVSKNDIAEDGITPCIRYGQLYTDYRETIDVAVSKTNLPNEQLVLSKAGDVIIPASGETRIDIATASCVINEGIALGGDLNIIRGDFNGVFIAYYLNAHLKTDIARLSQGSSVIHLYANQLKKLKLEIPVIEEQQKIADFLSTIDKKTEAVSQQIEKTQSFKKGLLQQMFV